MKWPLESFRDRLTRCFVALISLCCPKWTLPGDEELPYRQRSKGFRAGAELSEGCEPSFPRHPVPVAEMTHAPL